MHCRQPDYGHIKGQKLDQKGCVQPPGLPDETCKQSLADYEVYSPFLDVSIRRLTIAKGYRNPRSEVHDAEPDEHRF